MPYVIPPFTKIREDLLRDIKNLLPQADIGVDSDFYVRATSVASCAEGLYQHQAWIVKQIFPDTADTEYLEWHCALRGIYRKLAVQAKGTAVATGVEGTLIPKGTVIKTEDGRIYECTGDVFIGAGSQASIAVQSVNVGVAGNISNGIGAFIQIDSHVDSQVTQLTCVGGLEIESDSSLLERLLELLRRPPAGGNKYDYRNWALSVTGVSNAYVYPLRRGLGTVDIVITAGDDIPSQEVINRTQAYIDDVRPVTAKGALVLAPTKKPVNIVVQVRLTNLSKEVFEATLMTELDRLFGTVAPGDVLIKSKLEALISNITGVIDRVLVEPATNIGATVDESVVEWIRLGSVEVSLL